MVTLNTIHRISKAVKILVSIGILIISTERLLMAVSSSPQSEELPDFNKLWDFNDPAKTEEEFRSLLSLARESGDTSYYAQLLTQIAHHLRGERRRHEAAQLQHPNAFETLHA